MAKKYFFRFVFGVTNILFGSFYANAADGVPLPTNVGLPQGTIAGVISKFTNWLLAIFGFLAIISFIVSGIMYFLAAGDDTQQEKAKKQMQWSILGVIIGLAGLVVVYAVD